MLGTGADLKRSFLASWMINIVRHKTSYFSVGGTPCILGNSQWLSLQFARRISRHSWNCTCRCRVVVLQQTVRRGSQISVPLIIWSRSPSKYNTLTKSLHILDLLWERGCIISLWRRPLRHHYRVIRFCFQHISYIQSPVLNCTGLFFRKFAYTRYDVECTDFSSQ
jgi:hypothetical protein